MDEAPKSDNLNLEKEYRGRSPSRSEFDALKNIIYGAVLVLIVGFIALLVQYFTATQATYQNLVNQVTAQNAKIDALTQQINQLPKQ